MQEKKANAKSKIDVSDQIISIRSLSARVVNMNQGRQLSNLLVLSSNNTYF